MERKNIEIRIEGNYIEFSKEQKEIVNWYYPDANIRILGKRSRIQPAGFIIGMWDKTVQRECDFYSFLYPNFNINEIIVDKKGDEITLREETKQVEGDIKKVQGLKSINGYDDVWKFEVNLLDLSEEQCIGVCLVIFVVCIVIDILRGWFFKIVHVEDLCEKVSRSLPQL